MSASKETRRVAVIGCGNLGGALAEALLANGRKVTVWNRTASKCDALAARGASVAGSPAEAAASAAMVVLCVTGHDASLALLRPAEMAEALRGRLLVQLSTVTAEDSRETGRWAEAHGVAYLDGSVLCYPARIRSNEGKIVYSGPRRDFEAHRELLESLGASARLVGEAVGGAPSFDKAVYAYHYGSMLAFFQGAAICHAAGLALEAYNEEIASAGPAQKIHFGERIAERSYDNPGCALEVEAAAYAHVVVLSEALGLDATYPKLVASYFERAIAEGRGQQELASVFEVMIAKAA